jgi:hypothetical protein
MYFSLIYQNVDKIVMLSRALYAANILIDPSLVSQRALTLCTEFLVESILNYPVLSCSTNTYQLIPEALSQSLQVLSYFQITNGSLVNSTLLQAKIFSALSEFTQGCQAGLSAGEQAVSVVTGNIRVATQVMTGVGDLTLSAPVTSLQSLHNVTEGKVSLNAFLLSGGVSIVVYTSNPNQVVSNSTPITLETSLKDTNTRRRLGSTSKQMVTVSMSNPVSTELKYIVPVINILNCSYFTQHSYSLQTICPDGTRVNVTCPIMKRGYYNIQCPGLRVAPKMLIDSIFEISRLFKLLEERAKKVILGLFDKSIEDNTSFC